MPRRSRDHLRLIERELRFPLEWAFRELRIKPHEHRYQSTLIRTCARELLSTGEFCWDKIGVDFYLLKLPEIGPGEFWFVLPVPQELNFYRLNPGKREKRKCFIGCRYDRTYRKFRRILEVVLGHYGYEVPPPITGTGPILEDILRQLKSKSIEFALFDNRATERKPNVYIELGIAYTLGKPFMLFQHQRTVLPSDFGGFGALRYSSYHQFARELSLLFPRFLRENGIA